MLNLGNSCSGKMTSDELMDMLSDEIRRQFDGIVFKQTANNVARLLQY